MIDIKVIEIPCGTQSVIDFISRNSHKIIILCVSSEITRKKVSMIMKENGLHCSNVHHVNELLPHQSGIFTAMVYCDEAWWCGGVVFI